MHVKRQNSDFLKNWSQFAKYREENSCAWKTLTSCCLSDRKASSFLRFEKLVGNLQDQIQGLTYAMRSLCQQLNACLMFLMMLQSIGPPSTLPQHASSRVGAQVQQSGTVTEHATQKPQQRSLWQPLQLYVSSPCFVIFLFVCPCFVIFLFVCPCFVIFLFVCPCFVFSCSCALASSFSCSCVLLWWLCLFSMLRFIPR